LIRSLRRTRQIQRISSHGREQVKNSQRCRVGKPASIIASLLAALCRNLRDTAAQTPMFFRFFLVFVATITAILFSAGCGSASVEQALPKSKTADSTTAETAKRDPVPLEIAMDAALNGQTEIIQLALNNGTDPNSVDPTGRTALMLAAFNGHLDIAKILVGAGADLRAADQTGRTALMYASTGPNLPMVKFLLDHGAKINAADSHENWSPLMFAAAEGHMEVVKLLIDSGAAIDHQDIDGETAAMFAQNAGHAHLLPLLITRK